MVGCQVKSLVGYGLYLGRLYQRYTENQVIDGLYFKSRGDYTKDTHCIT